MRIAIIGTGALGTFLAARLSAAGYEVTAVCRGKRLQQVRTEGLKLELGGRIDVVKVNATDNLQLIPELDLAVIATQTDAVSAISKALKRFDRPGLVVLTLQNGVDAPAQVAVQLPDSQIAAARVHGFFELNGDVVRHQGVVPSIAFGPVSKTSIEELKPLVSALAAAGIDHRGHARIMPILWEKLVLASPIGGIGAMLGASVGEMRSAPAVRAMLAEAMDEVAAVATARGVQLMADCVQETMAFLDTFPSGATSSLHRDIAAGRTGEFYALTGAIPRLAAEAGVSVPVHEAVVATLQQKFGI